MRLLIPIFLFSSTAMAADDYIMGIPNLMDQGPHFTLHQAILGRTCFSLEASPLDIDCNPAFLANQEKHTLRFNLVANNDAKNLFDAYKGLKSDEPIDAAEKIMNDHDPKQGEAAAAVWYQRDFWAIGFIPMHYGLSYLNRNEAYPQLSVYGVQETEAFFKIGAISSEDRNFRVGVQSRWVSRKYIYQKFYALDVIADPEMIEMSREKAFYIEPGFAYTFHTSWKPTLAAMISNLPVYQSGDELPDHPNFDLGLSTVYPGLPQFRSTLHYHRAAYEDNFFRSFYWGGVYDFSKCGAVSATFGSNLYGIGIDGRISIFTAGLGYRNERIKQDTWNEKTVESTTLELGLTF